MDDVRKLEVRDPDCNEHGMKLERETTTAQHSSTCPVSVWHAKGSYKVVDVILT